jgi:RNA polymerase sigma-70 factor (ECF subfamily)
MNNDCSELKKTEWVRAAMDRYAGPLTRYATLITGDRELAQDVVQDVLVRLCAEQPEQVDAHLAQWLFRVCRNRALDVQRKQSRMEPLSDLELNMQASPEPSPATQAERREAAGEVLELMASLPKSQQEVLRLKFQNGLSYHDISSVTDLTVSNVGFLIHTALKTIRRQLQPKPGTREDPLRRWT